MRTGAYGARSAGLLLNELCAHVKSNALRDGARVVQHETDHLDGVLFFDRMTSMETLTYLDEYSRYHTRPEED